MTTPLHPPETIITGHLLAIVFNLNDDHLKIPIDWPLEYAQFRHLLEVAIVHPCGRRLWNLMRFITSWPFFEELLLDFVDVAEKIDFEDIPAEASEQIAWSINIGIIAKYLAHLPTNQTWEEFAEMHGWDPLEQEPCAARS